MLDFGKQRDLKYVSFSKKGTHPATRERQSRIPKREKPTDLFFSKVRKLVVIFFLLLVAGGIGALITLGYKSYNAVSAIIVSNSRSGELPVVGAVASDDLPIINWEKKKERINILLLGLDRRSWEQPEYTRTDTIVVASINPEDKTVILLSIPRDLEVPYENEDGYVQYVRVNSVHVFARDEDDKGSGPAAVKKVVSEILGIPIHYFFRVDFDGFRSLIDEIGGVTIDVQYPLYDYEYPDEAYGYQTVKIDTGIQLMDGDTALKYARSRHALDAHQQGDLNRARRQQEVIIAAKEKVIASKWDILTDPRKVASLLDTLKENILTDIQINEMIELAKLGKEIDTNNPRKVLTRVISSPLIYHEDREGNGWRYYAVDPTFKEIQNYVAEMFADPFLREDMEAEAAAIRVENGTSNSGLANLLTYDLRQNYDLNLLKAVTADRDDYHSTVIYDMSNGQYPRTVAFLEKYLGVDAFVPSEIAAGENANIVIIVGEDYQLDDDTEP